MASVEAIADPRLRERAVGGPIAPATERHARADLRRQVARLERELAELFTSAFPRRGFDWGVGAVGGPKLLTIGDLERVRDALAARLRDARSELGRQAEREEQSRLRLEAMIAAPERHRWDVVTQREIGVPGCGRWESRPRWGLLGMLLGWWRIRLSSGCPLSEGLRPPARTGQASDGAEAAQAAAAAPDRAPGG